jgi:hypothetical protein
MFGVVMHKRPAANCSLLKCTQLSIIVMASRSYISVQSKNAVVVTSCKNRERKGRKLEMKITAFSSREAEQ